VKTPAFISCLRISLHATHTPPTEAHRRNTAQDTFANHTPSEVKTFTNVIAAKDLGASRRVIVAACFGIGFFPSYPGNLNLAEILDPLLNSLLERLENGLKGDKVISVATHKLIFFDGEAAFNQGLDHNGLYIGCKLFAPLLRYVEVRSTH